MKLTHKRYVLRFVVFMLLVPVDTSEAERIFSLMNDSKTHGRTRLQQHNLSAMMVWNYYCTATSLNHMASASA